MRAKLAAEFVGTAFLLIGVVGSGIAAERLTDDVGLQLFQNAAATAGVLVAIILMFGAVSGAHVNPAVTLLDWAVGDTDTGTALRYVPTQVAGAVVGVVLANLMFDLPAVEWSTTARSGGNLWLAEVIATVGLLLVIQGTVRSPRPHLVAFGVAAYIGGAYYFTSSTSFANPAVTVGRMFSDTFAGIEPASAPMFIVMQLVGVAVALGLVRLIWQAPRRA